VSRTRACKAHQADPHLAVFVELDRIRAGLEIEAESGRISVDLRLRLLAKSLAKAKLGRRVTYDVMNPSP